MCAKSIPGAGFEPAPTEGGRDFKSVGAVLGRNDLAPFPSVDVSAGVGQCAPVSVGVATDLATGSLLLLPATSGAQGLHEQTRYVIERRAVLGQGPRPRKGGAR